jgi:hypothetical protein
MQPRLRKLAVDGEGKLAVEVGERRIGEGKFGEGGEFTCGNGGRRVTIHFVPFFASAPPIPFSDNGVPLTVFLA